MAPASCALPPQYAACPVRGYRASSFHTSSSAWFAVSGHLLQKAFAKGSVAAAFVSFSVIASCHRRWADFSDSTASLLLHAVTKCSLLSQKTGSDPADGRRFLLQLCMPSCYNLKLKCFGFLRKQRILASTSYVLCYWYCRSSQFIRLVQGSAMQKGKPQ